MPSTIRDDPHIRVFSFGHVRHALKPGRGSYRVRDNYRERKHSYNLTVTIISVVIALLIGSIEAMGLLKDQLKLTGRLWEYVDSVTNSFGTIGFATIFLFVAIWLESIAFAS
jgi:high-affinity nickel permease